MNKHAIRWKAKGRLTWKATPTASAKYRSAQNENSLNGLSIDEQQNSGEVRR
jgi:hypothetical protein